VPQLVKAGKSDPDEFATSALAEIKSQWFGLNGYLTWKTKPIVMMFGPQYYKEPDLNRLFTGPISLFTLLGKRGPAVGAFGWPEPQVGNDRSWIQLQSFYDRAKAWETSMPVAYPRFLDIYKDAGVGPGYGEIKDDAGATFNRSLDLALGSGAPFIQVATWNDWGEGTQIEPSLEFEDRDLRVLQENRKKVDPEFPWTTADLQLPEQIYRLRKSGVSPRRLHLVVHDLLLGQGQRAAVRLEALKG
jgi:hypothetical protein